MVDPASMLVVADTKSAARPADRGTPRADDASYRAFLRAFKLTDLVDLHPVPTENYSCFEGTARSRIDTVTCHMDATIAIASDHYWGNTLQSNHHVPLLFTLAHPVVRLEKPYPHTVSHTPEHHMGPVAISPADATDFRASVLRRRDIDPQIAQVRWLKCLQRAIYQWAAATGRVGTLSFRQYRLRSRPAERASPSQSL